MRNIVLLVLVLLSISSCAREVCTVGNTLYHHQVIEACIKEPSCMVEPYDLRLYQARQRCLKSHRE